jgi:hypothetical protein
VLITQAEFARLAGVSRSAVKQAINNALITAIVEQGGKILIDKNEGLQQYQANSRRQRKPSAAAPPPPISTDRTGLDLLSWGQAPAEAENTPTNPEPQQSKPAKPALESLPEYGKSRARSEYERANLLELDRKTKEGHLLRREDVEQAWGGAVNITRTRLLGVASTARQRIPHLDVEEVELITTLIREALEELAAGELKQ